MTKSHKVLVLVPPLLIGVTVLMIFFSVQHAKNQQSIELSPAQQSATTSDYFVSDKLPVAVEPSPLNESPQTEPGDEPVATDQMFCTMDAKQCPDGSFVGRSGPDCSFAACPDASNNQPQTACELTDREVEACIEIYAPVCGAKQVQCVTTPCEPIPTTYSNSCFACMDAQVTGYTAGACASDL